MSDRPDSLLWWRAGMLSAMTFLLGAPRGRMPLRGTPELSARFNASIS